MIYREFHRPCLSFTCIFISQNGKPSKLHQDITEFYQWFVGFSDASNCKKSYTTKVLVSSKITDLENRDSDFKNYNR